MSRSGWNFLVDALLGAMVAGHLAVSSVVYFVFPAPSEAGGWTVWTWPYDTWSKLQMWTLFAFAFMVLIHLILHWTWICGFVRTRIARLTDRRAVSNDSANTLFGVSTLIVALTALGLFVLAADFGAVKPAVFAKESPPPWSVPLSRP